MVFLGRLQFCVLCTTVFFFYVLRVCVARFRVFVFYAVFVSRTFFFVFCFLFFCFCALLRFFFSCVEAHNLWLFCSGFFWLHLDLPVYGGAETTTGEEELTKYAAPQVVGVVMSR